MVPVQEDQGLFVNSNKEGIEQLREFTQDEKLYPQACRSRPICQLRVKTEVISQRQSA